MLLTNRTGVKNTRDLLRAFGGLNETYGCTEAEYSGGMNFSARDFPALSTRLPRRRLQELAGLNGMYHLNGLLTVCGQDLVYTPDEAPAQPVTVKNAVADSRKTMVGIGTKILIFPDKVAFDTADGSAAKLGAAWEAGSQSVSFATCDASGNTYEVKDKGTKEPEHPQDGQLFLKLNEPDKPYSAENTLEVYSEASDNWTVIPLDYCLVTAEGIGAEFRVGDTVTLRDSDMNTLTVTVSGIFDNYVSNYAIVSADTCRDQWGSVPPVKTAFIRVTDNSDAGVHAASARILDLENVSAVSVNLDTRQRVGTMMSVLDYIVWMVTVCAGALAFIVLYNLTNININERIREIATIKVLGFYPGETAAYVFRENNTLTFLGMLVGLPLGKWLHAYVMSQIRIDTIAFDVRIAWQSVVFSMLLTAVFAAIVNVVMYFKLRRISMAESLKSIE